MLLPAMFSKDKAAVVDDTLPSEDAVSQALACSVHDGKGNAHLLSSLVSKHPRTIIVFVRHHHCGVCMEYVRLCSKNDRLHSTTKEGEAQTQVIVIGHGTWEGIDRYRKLSDCAFNMYSSQDQRVYTALGMTRRFLGKTDTTQKAPYLGDKSELSVTMSSLYERITSGANMFKGGDIALLGGECVLEGGEQGVGLDVGGGD